MLVWVMNLGFAGGTAAGVSVFDRLKRLLLLHVG